MMITQTFLPHGHMQTGYCKSTVMPDALSPHTCDSPPCGIATGIITESHGKPFF